MKYLLIDCGYGQGKQAKEFVESFPTGYLHKIIGFDPILTHANYRSPYQETELLAMGVGAHECTLPLHYNPRKLTEASFISEFSRENTYQIDKVQVVNLADFIKKRVNWKTHSVSMQLDINGMEFLVLSCLRNQGVLQHIEAIRVKWNKPENEWEEAIKKDICEEREVLAI